MHISHGRSGQPSEQRTATFTGTVLLDPVLNVPGEMVNTEWGGEVAEGDYQAAQP